MDTKRLKELSGIVAESAKSAANIKHLKDKAAQNIFQSFLDVIQDAEEMGGPEGDGYIELMDAIVKEAQKRVVNFKSMNENLTEAEVLKTWQEVDDMIQSGEVDTVSKLLKACADKGISYKGFSYLEKRMLDKLGSKANTVVK